MKGMILVILMSLFLLSSVSAFPIIISTKGVNHTQAKELVYSVPEEYFGFVDEIMFIDKEYAKCKTIDIFGQKICWKNYAQAYWNKNHICYKTQITMTDLNRTILIHETNHIYDYCANKVDISMEEFADKFRR